jgi:hypothetical protein
MAIRRFSASVAYRAKDGAQQEDEFPVWSDSYAHAKELALAYVLQVLKLGDFELRLAGA